MSPVTVRPLGGAKGCLLMILVSVVLSALGFGGLVYGLSTLGEGGDAALPAWVPLVLGVAALAVFVRRQTRLQRADRALLDLRTFRSRVFTMSTAVLAVSMMALFGTLIVLPIYLQTVHGLDPLGTGLLLAFRLGSSFIARPGFRSSFRSGGALAFQRLVSFILA